MTLFDEQRNIDPEKLFQELKQDVTQESSTQAQNTSTQETIPYARFAEVNERAKQLEAQNAQMLEQFMRQQNTSQGQGYTQAAQNAQQQTQQARDLLTPDEIEYFNQRAITDPGSSYQELARLVGDRVVDTRVKEMEQRLTGQMQQYVNQFSQQMAPVALQNFEQQNFADPRLEPAKKVFRELVEQESKSNPAVVNNPTALAALRGMALGRVYESQLTTPTQTQPPFSEQGGSPFGQIQGRQSTIDPRAVEVAKRLGVSEQIATKVYDVFEKNGVFRNEY